MSAKRKTESQALAPKAADYPSLSKTMGWRKRTMNGGYNYHYSCGCGIHETFYMKKKVESILCSCGKSYPIRNGKIWTFIFLLLPIFGLSQSLSYHMVNPCGGDWGNEWIFMDIDRTIGANQIAAAAIAPYSGNAQPDFNFWFGASFPVGGNEPCGTSGFRCYEYTVDSLTIQQRLNELNSAAGCNLFVGCPDSLQAGDKLMFFLGGVQGFDNPAANLDFSAWCGDNPQQIKALFFFGNMPTGYFSNTQPRQLRLYPSLTEYAYFPYPVGQNAGYYTPSQSYSVLYGCDVLQVEDIDTTNEPTQETVLDTACIRLYSDFSQKTLCIPIPSEHGLRIALFALDGRMVWKDLMYGDKAKAVHLQSGMYVLRSGTQVEKVLLR